MANRLLALVLGVAMLAALIAAGRQTGLVRDEGYYFDAAERYLRWWTDLPGNLWAREGWRSFNTRTIDRAFDANHEHPALMKTLFGLSWLALHKCQCRQFPELRPVAYTKPHRNLGWLSESSAFRLPTQLLAALLVVMIFVFGCEICDRRAGLVAALLFATLPRAFFHSTLATFDIPIAFMWFLVVYCYWRSLGSWRWGMACGVAFGLALATKHNAWFIPGVLVLHYLWMHRQRLRRLRPPPIPLALVAMLVIGPLVFLAHWPWIWHHTWPRLQEYVGFHLHHSYYNIEYLGQNYNRPPFPVGYPFVMTLFTAPVVTVVLCLAGLGVVVVDWLRRIGRPSEGVFGIGMRPTFGQPGRGIDPASGMLIVVSALVSMVPFATRHTPIFGATKHWLPAMPFLCLLAGIAFSRLLRGLVAHTSLGTTRRRAATALAGLLAFAVIAASAVETAHSVPYGLSYYNALAGGVPGGADLGLNRQFWGYSVRGVLPYLNRATPKRGPVYFHDANHDNYAMYVREGLLRPDIEYAGYEEPAVRRSDLSMVVHELHMNKYEYMAWDAYGTARPSHVLAKDGVPLVTVFARPGRGGVR